MPGANQSDSIDFSNAFAWLELSSLCSSRPIHSSPADDP